MLNLSMAFTSQYLNDVKYFDNHPIVFISGLYKTECDSPYKDYTDAKSDRDH